MRALVTGGAGFIGSHLAQALLEDGHQVRIVDNLTDYYDIDQKLDNLESVGGGAEILDADLRTADLRSLVTDRRGVPPGRPTGRPALVGRGVRGLRLVQRAGHPTAARGLPGRPPDQVRVRLQLVGVRGRRAVSDRSSPTCPDHGAPTA